ncbi:hypothetical protein T484DRAFT_1857490 [Baffinella frigidus]|nr:hypothetical protein T484DRAFT_1857490 [Cryptophyta sp. CCMP2293]
MTRDADFSPDAERAVAVREAVGVDMLRKEQAYVDSLGGMSPWVAYSTQVPHKQWLVDLEIYESGAPSWRYLYEMGWYDQPEANKRASVYNAFHVSRLFVELTYQKGPFLESDAETDALDAYAKAEGLSLYAAQYNSELLHMMSLHKRQEARCKCNDTVAARVYAASMSDEQWHRDKGMYQQLQAHPLWPARNEGFHYWGQKQQREHVYSSVVQRFLWDRLVRGSSVALPAVMVRIGEQHSE